MTERPFNNNIPHTGTQEENFLALKLLMIKTTDNEYH